MAILTASTVFEFCGTSSTHQTAKTTLVTNEIARQIALLEEGLGRKVQPTQFTDLILQDGLNCKIYGDKLFLTGIYRDTYSISSISEAGTSLTAVSGYADSGDYYLDTTNGILIRKDRDWSTDSFALKISGYTGIGKGSVLEDINEYLVQSTAIATGLWYSLVKVEGVDTAVRVRNLPKKTEEIFHTYRQTGFF